MSALQDPAVITAALGLIINGLLSYFRDKRRAAIDTARYNERKAATGVLIQKVDENTQENREQIKVGNHVNEKLVQTTQTAQAAATVAVQANSVAVDAMTQVTRDIAELKAQVKALLYAMRRRRRRSVVKPNVV